MKKVDEEIRFSQTIQNILDKDDERKLKESPSWAQLEDLKEYKVQKARQSGASTL